MAVLSTNTNIEYVWTLSLDMNTTASTASTFAVGISAECQPNQAMCEPSHRHTYWRQFGVVDVLTVRLRFYERGIPPRLSYSTNGRELSGSTHIEVSSRLTYKLAVSLQPQTKIRIRSLKIRDMM